MAKKTVRKTNAAPSGRTALLIAGGAAALAAVCIVLLLVLRGGGGPQAPQSDLLGELRALRGYSRSVSQREYDFFRELAARELYGGEGADLDQLARERAAEVSARFYLGSRLGLCETFDFATLEYRMEQENAVRQAKLEAGEAVYGAKQYTLPTYFSYLDSNLETDLLNYLIGHADQPMLEQAEAYYDADPDRFRMLTSITYTLERDGQTSTESVDSAGLRTLQNAGDPLGDFLASAQPGEALDFTGAEGEALRAVLKETKYETPAFADAQGAVLSTWLNAEVLDGLYETVARNNPLTFPSGT